MFPMGKKNIMTWESVKVICVLFLGEYGYLQMVVVIVSENSTSPGTLINLDQFRVVSRARNPI